MPPPININQKTRLNAQTTTIDCDAQKRPSLIRTVQAERKESSSRQTHAHEHPARESKKEREKTKFSKEVWNPNPIVFVVGANPKNLPFTIRYY
jgi:hypothetical protein